MINRSLILENKFIATRASSEEICARLEVEDYVVQPNPEVSPPKWHLGHTTWFLEELILNKFNSQFKFYNEGFRPIFNSYYKSLGPHWRQSERGHLSRPLVKEIFNYRKIIDDQIIGLVSQYRESKEFLDLIELAINHEEQHQELLMMDIKAILAINPLKPAYDSTIVEKHNPTKEKWKLFETGVYEIGTSATEIFHYDNEGPRHKVYIHPFGISEKLVTNGEYLNFIKDGGYTQALLWKSMGLDWVQSQKISVPLYWNKDLSSLSEYSFYGETQLDLNAPVAHINYFEADAFARWMGMRLPTEQEFELASIEFPLSPPNSEYRPLDTGTFNSQLWCWTQSQYSPYPGYRPYEGAINEYNGKFMCNQFVMKGGCFATPYGHYKKTYRNFFEPQQRWMFSGICLAKDDL